MKKTLLLTFDYELYLGANSGSAMNCSLRPTDKILTILNRNGCKGIFFIDALYLVRLKEVIEKYPAAKNDFDKVAAQIQRMVKEGHSVFAHLHPHWLDAKYDAEKNVWNLADKSRFALNNLKPEEQSKAFDSIMEVLYDIIRPVDPTYRINGFRAGGLFIQPFSLFKPLFLKHGIQYEFSVQEGAKCSGPDNAYSFDFTQTPDKNFYRFEEDVTAEKADGSFIEFPLRMCKVQGMPKIISGIYYRLTSRNKYWQRHGDGLPSGNQIKFEKAPGESSRFAHTEGFSVESMNSFKLFYYERELETNQHLHIISHPKLVSDYNLEIFDRFLKKVTRKFELTTDIETIISQN